MEEPLLRHDSDGITTLTINRAEKLNALDVPATEALISALRSIESDPGVRVVILTGTGRGFCTGQDLAEYAGAKAAKLEFSIGEHLQRGFNVVTTLLRRIEKPIIAAVNGVTAGVGFSLALACDLRLASEEASFTLGFSRIGLIPDGGASLLLPTIAGIGRAFFLAYTSDRIDAALAHEFGIVDRVVPAEQLEESAAKLARTIAAQPATGLALTKRAFNRAMFNGLEGWLAEEAALQQEASQAADHAEGIAAFLERRKPAFTGR